MPSAPPASHVWGGSIANLGLILMAAALAASPLYPDFAEPICCRYRVGPLPTTLLEIVLLVATAVGLIQLRGRLPWRHPYLWPGLLLLAGAVIGTLVSPDRRGALGILKAYFVEPMLAGLVIGGLVAGRREARILLGGLAVAGLIGGLANLPGVILALADHTFDPVHPPHVIYNTPNAIALFLVPLDAMALALALYSADRRERVLALVFLLITVPAVILSYSRGGWLALALVLVVVGAFHPRRWWMLGVAVVLALGLGLGVGSIRRRILTELDPSSRNNTAHSRLLLWRSTLDMLAHRPVLGGGLNGFQSSVAPYRVAGFTEILMYPHNVVLNFWTETGVVGLAGFGWLVVAMVTNAVRSLAGDPWVRAVGIGLVGVVVAILAHGLVDVPYFKNDLSLELWALVGIHIGLLRGVRGPLQA